ncbi:MAG: undecaprenyl-diphosphate phosphatase [Planctomycetota bacterium]
MDWWQAIVLGVVEGLTEYLPVSSTGHLILAQRAMGLTGEAANAYAICIQAGAILAVLGLYRKRVKQVSAGWLGKAGLGSGDEAGFKLGLNMLIAFMPAAVVGLLLDDWIEANLFGLWPVVLAWLLGGVAILATAWWRKRRDQASGKGCGLEDMTWMMALGIGMIQCAAMWPGTSRSLVTIVGGVLVGLSLAAAVEFSFLLGVVTLCAATVYKSIDQGPIMLAEYGWGPMIVGSIAAWASAVAAVTWMVSYLKKHGMEVFGYYRIGLAVVVGGLLLGGVLSAG